MIKRIFVCNMLFAKVLIFFIFLFSFFIAATGQNVELLEKELQKTTSLIQKVDLLDSIAYTVRNTDEKKFLDYTQQAYQLAKQHNYTLGIAREASLKAWYWHYKQEVHDSSLYYYQEAYSYYEKLKNNERICKMLSEIGLIYHQQNDLEKALGYQIKALSLVEKNKTISGRMHGNICYRIGNIYVDQKDNTKAIEYYQKALSLYEKAQFKKGIASTCIGLGNLYEAQNKLIESIQFKENALKMYTEFKDTSVIVVCLINLSNSYTTLNKYEKSIETVQQADNLLNKIKKTPDLMEMQVKTWLSLADLYHLKRDKNKAIEYLKKAHYYITNQNIDKELRYSVLYDIYEIIFNLAKNIQQNDIALLYAEKWLMVKDSLYAQNKVKMLYELEKKYKTEKKEQQIRMLNIEKQQETDKKRFFSILFILSVIILVSLGLLLFYLRKLNKRLYHQKQDLIQLNEVKNKLFSVLTHDLRSPIYQMSKYLDTFKPDTDTQKQHHQEIQEKLYRTQNLIDSLLYWATTQLGRKNISTGRYALCSIIDEVFEQVHNQAESKGVLLINEIDNNLFINTDKATLQIVLRNLLTNAIKFSYNGSLVRVYATQNDNKTDIFVQDYGIGMSEEDLHNLLNAPHGKTNKGTAQEEGTGTGFKLVLEYIKQLNAHIQGYSKPEQGTIFQISLSA